MTVEMVAPQTPTPRRSRKTTVVWIGAVVAAVVAAGCAGYQALASGEFPKGAHPVEVYTVVDELTTSGANGNHLFGMCDADTYYIKVDSAELCVVLNGSLGTVQAEGTETGIVLDAAAVGAVRGMVREADAGGSDRTTQVLLQYEGSPVALVAVASLEAGGAVTATSVSS